MESKEAKNLFVGKFEKEIGDLENKEPTFEGDLQDSASLFNGQFLEEVKPEEGIKREVRLEKQSLERKDAPGFKRKYNQLFNHIIAGLTTLGLSFGAVTLASPELRQEIARKVRKLLESEDSEKKVLEKAEDIVRSLKEAKDLEARADLSEKEKYELLLKKIDFFLDVLKTKVGISEEEQEKTRAFLLGIHEKYKKQIMDTSDTKEILFELFKETGKYNPDLALLSDIANQGQGNCEARATFLIVTIPALFPEMELKLQWFGPDEKNSDGHVRVIAKMEGYWYALEGAPKKLEPEDLLGTVLTDTLVFENSLRGDVQWEKPIGAPDFTVRTVSEDNKKTKTNSPFSVRFGSPPTKSYSGSNELETDEQYKQRSREKYFAGEVFDPENLPPMKVFIGETVESTAIQMASEGKRSDSTEKKDLLRPEDPHPLPEEVRMKALLEGVLQLNYSNTLYGPAALPQVFFDISEFDDQAIRTVEIIGVENSQVMKKYKEILEKKFRNIKNIVISDASGTLDFSFVRNFPFLQDVSLDGELPNDVSFLKDLRSLARIKLSHSTFIDSHKQSLDKHDSFHIDLSPLQHKKLTAIILSGEAIFENASLLDPTDLEVFTVKVFPETEEDVQKFLQGADNLKELDLTISDRLSSNTRTDFSSFKKLSKLYIGKGYSKQQEGPEEKFELETLRGLPLKVLKISNFRVDDLQPLSDMPLQELRIGNFVGEDITPLSTLSSVGKIYFAFSGSVPQGFADLSKLKKLRSLVTIQQVNSPEEVFSNLDFVPLHGLRLKEFFVETYSHDSQSLDGSLPSVSPEGIYPIMDSDNPKAGFIINYKAYRIVPPQGFRAVSERVQQAEP